MKKTAPKKVFQHRFNQPLTLFWRLFLSMLAILLLTSALSVGIERWINAKELNNKMQLQVVRLTIARQHAADALADDDLKALEQLYHENRWLTSQMRIVDEKDTVIQPRFGRFHPDKQNSKENDSAPPPDLENPPPLSSELSLPPLPEEPNPGFLPSWSEQSWRQVSADISNYPELKDTTIVSNNGISYTIQLQPKLSLPDLISLRKDHSLIRVSLILLFSILVCYWLSRALIGRIERVQEAVHLMTEGRFSTGEELKDLGNDELGMLAKDVSNLSTRLANSELARKQMLSDISHELRSPLARLEVATELTRDFAPEVGDYLDRIEKESGRMNELIEHIIQIQSLQMRQYALDIEAHQHLNLYALIDGIKEDFCFEFQEKSVTWQWQLLDKAGNKVALDQKDNTLYELMGDQQQLHSAFENIIRNAFTHTTDHSTVKIVLQPFIEADSQLPYLKLQVIDQGSGVAEIDLQRIFQPFVRLSSSRERLNPTAPTSPSQASSAQQSASENLPTPKKYSGYGLGLAIAHAVILAHQGQLTAFNRQDGLSGLVIEALLPTHL